MYSDTNKEQFSVHPKIKDSGYFSAFGKGEYTIMSNRPALREQGYAHRPQYCLEEGKMKGEHFEILVNHLDDFVRRNFD